MNYCLIDAPILTPGRVEVLKIQEPINQRFYEMGIRKNAQIQVVGRLGRSFHILVGGESMILRENEARLLEIHIPSS